MNYCKPFLSVGAVLAARKNTVEFSYKTRCTVVGNRILSSAYYSTHQSFEIINYALAIIIILIRITNCHAYPRKTKAWLV